MQKILLQATLWAASWCFAVQTAQAQCTTIYASPTGNSLADGSEAAPVDLQTALNQACSQGRPHIRLLSGTYNLTSKIIINCNDIFIDGDWEVVGGVGRKNSNLVTTININSPLETAAYDGGVGTTVGFYIGVQAIGRTGFRIHDITFNVKNGGTSGAAVGTTGNRGNSVYGFYFRNATGWTLERCAMNVGQGSQGASGINGAFGLTGNGGGTGLASGCDDKFTNRFGGGGGPAVGVGIRQGGAGGTGGRGSDYNSNNNTSGVNGTAGGGGAAAGSGFGAAGASGGGGTDCNRDGRAGGNGAAGAAGVNGAALPTSTNFSFFWEPSAQSGNGTDGAGGGGGQGGGGGGRQNCTLCNDGAGNGGGGGGGGGEGGQAGTGGWGGGGSFAIYQYASTGTRIDVSLNSAGAASGGVAGIGGNGGAGGANGVGANGNNASQTGCCGTLSGRACGNCEVGAGGRGGAGGAGGRGGDGAPGASGLGETVRNVAGGSSTNTTNPAITQVITNQPLQGCTNSEIIITKDAGTWTLPGTASFINNLNATSSSYNTASNTAIIRTTTAGFHALIINGVQYPDFIYTPIARPLPTFAPTMLATICEGQNFFMSTPTAGAQYEWIIFAQGSNVNSPLGIFTNQVASWTPPNNGVTTNYSVRLRVRDNCCGWSSPVYFNFAVVAASTSPTATGTTICAGNTATLTATGSAGVNITWYSDALGQLALQTNAGPNSTFTTPALNQTTVYYVGEGISGCSGPLTSVQVTVNPRPVDPSASNVIVCQGSNIVFNAATSGGTVSWFAAPTGGTALATGNSYNAGALAAGNYT